MAGLAAAQILQQSGVRVQVLEGRDRIGGRIHTNTDLGFPVDLGAAWIHGITDNPITALASDHGIPTQPTDYDSLTLQDHSNPVSAPQVAQGYRRYERLRDAVKAYGTTQAQDLSLQQGIDRWLTQQAAEPLDRVLSWWLASETALDLGLDPADLSLWAWEEDDTFSGADHLFPGGFGQLPAVLASDLTIALGQTVTAIATTATGVTITTLNGTSYTADAAIITVPLGVLQAGTLQFDPPLPPDTQAAIAALTMGLLNKVILTFPRQFWPDTHILGQVEPEAGPVTYGVNLSAYQQDRPALTWLSGGQQARQQEALEDEALVAALMTALRSRYPSPLPEPTGMLRTQWQQDPFARGAYSNLPVGSTARDRATLSRPISPQLHFAGEATSTSYPGTVHGAYLSGRQTAQRLLQQWSV
jgi:monoamine oxidase